MQRLPIYPPMAPHVRDEHGFGMVELLAAMTILSVALLALMASYDGAFLAFHNSTKTSAAANIADNQLELVDTLSYAQIGLDQSTYASVEASNATYTSDESDVVGSSTVHTISGCGTTANCLPVQTVTGSDGKAYTLETFVYDVANGASWSERTITAIVRDPNESGSPIVAEETTAVDPGPNGP